MMKAKKYTQIVAPILIMLIGMSAFGFRTYKAETDLESTKINLQLKEDELLAAQENLIASQDSLHIATEKYKNLNAEYNSIIEDMAETQNALEVAHITIEELKSKEYKLVYLGTFKLTHYCPGFHGEPCGTGDGLTATGTKVTPGRTIAVDPKVIPYGTEVYIEGYGWHVAEDCGGAIKGNHIDVAMESHDAAMSSGIKHGGVWLLVKNKA
jgi:3D (Asp-Asp-Asp) domain-containing protein